MTVTGVWEEETTDGEFKECLSEEVTGTESWRGRRNRGKRMVCVSKGPKAGHNDEAEYKGELWMHLNKIYISNMAAVSKKLPGALQATEGRLDFVLFGGPLPLMVPTLSIPLGTPRSEVRCLQWPQHTEAVLQMSPNHSNQQHVTWIRPFLMLTQHPIPTPTKIQIHTVPYLRYQTFPQPCPQINLKHKTLLSCSRSLGWGDVDMWWGSGVGHGSRNS